MRKTIKSLISTFLVTSFMISTIAASVFAASSIEITKQPSDVKIDLGQKATFSVEATGDDLTYQWFYKLKGKTEYVEWAGRTGKSFTCTPTAKNDGMSVYCHIEDASGQKLDTEEVTLTYNAAFAITKQPKDVTINLGEKALFEIEATGTDLTYQWYYCLKGKTEFVEWTGRVSKAFTASTTAKNEGMSVYCIVTDGNKQTLKSDIVTLSYNKGFEITKQPQDVTIKLGERAPFAIEVSGTGLTYQWYYKLKGKADFAIWDGRTAKSFTAATNEKNDGMQVYCVVTNDNNETLTSDIATLTYKSDFEITKQPGDVFTSEGQRSTFAVEATGDGLTYQWFYKLNGKTEFVEWTGRTSKAFNCSTTTKNDRMQFYCVITDANKKSLQTETFTLYYVEDMKITKQPVDVKTQAGTRVIFDMDATGTDLKYQWYYKLDGKANFVAWSGRVSKSFGATLTNANNNMEVYCTVTDVTGKEVNTDTIKISIVAPVEIVKQPASITEKVKPGSEVSFEVEAKGEGLNYSWYDTAATVTVEGQTTNILKFIAGFQNMGHRFVCIITDEFDNKVTSDEVTYELDYDFPSVVTDPASHLIPLGNKITISAQTKGTDVSYQWYRKGANDTKYTLWQETKEASFDYTPVLADDGMSFYIRVIDNNDNKLYADSKPAKITFVHTDIVISSQPEDQTITTGDSVTLTVKATGESLKYQWFYMNPGESRFTPFEGKTTNILTFTPAEKNSGVKVYCQITDVFDSQITTNMATITVNPKFQITAQPADIKIDLDATAKLTVAATGTDLKYQWYESADGKIFTKLTNKTAATLSFVPTPSQDGHMFYCEVSDGTGATLDSDKVTLTFNKVALVISKDPSSVNTKLNETVSFAVSATGSKITYQWFQKTAKDTSFKAMSGKTAATLTLTADGSLNGAQYYVVVTDAFGEYLTSKTATLTFTKTFDTTIVTQPEDVTIDEGDSASFSIDVVSDDASYQWYKKAAGATSFTAISGGVRRTLTINSSDITDGMSVYCKVTDIYGDVFDSDIATVTIKKVVKTIEITSQPRNVSVTSGKSATFSVVADGTGLTYQWFYSIGAVDGIYTLWSGKTAATLTFTPTASQDDMYIYCKVTDASGNFVKTRSAHFMFLTDKAAACSHDSGYYCDNGDGTHSFLCYDCNAVTTSGTHQFRTWNMDIGWFTENGTMCTECNHFEGKKEVSLYKNPLSVGSSMNVNVSNPDNGQIFVFTPSKDGVYTFSATSTTTNRPMLELYSEGITLLQKNDDFVKVKSLDCKLQAGNTYYIKLSGTVPGTVSISFTQKSEGCPHAHVYYTATGVLHCEDCNKNVG